MPIRRMDTPRAGMLLLDQDIALDASRKRAVAADSPDARFVLGVAGAEVTASVVRDLAGVEIKDQHVSLTKTPAKPEPASTGPVPATVDRGSTVEEGEPISTAELDAGPVAEPPREPGAEKPKDAKGK